MEKYVKKNPAQIHQNNDAEMREDVKLGMPLSSSYIRSLIRPYSIRDREKKPRHARLETTFRPIKDS